MGDDAFRTDLESAHALAAARATRVTSLQGYNATLAGFANSFGDKHLRSIPMLELARPDWAGLIVVKTGSRWAVIDAEDGSPEADMVGAELVSCDGRTPQDGGRQLLGGFRADWSVAAQQAEMSPWLLISEGNPFTPRPRACVFSIAGRLQTWTLDWRPIARRKLDLRLAKANSFGAAGFGVRRVGAGYWIALQDLMDDASPVVDQVDAQSAAMREAPYIVLDLRGNGGGSSLFGDKIATDILGADYVRAVEGAAGDGCPGEVVRASQGNIDTLQRYINTGFPSRSPDVVGPLTAVLKQMRAAKAAGRAFSGPLICPAPRKVAATPAYGGKLFVLTDGACFSSCLAVVENLRSLGAVQIGQLTDANTSYTDVRDVLMPSGLSSFSTMMGVSPGAPPRIGPFIPQRLYDGDIADTAKLQAWVASFATS